MISDDLRHKLREEDIDETFLRLLEQFPGMLSGEKKNTTEKRMQQKRLDLVGFLLNLFSHIRLILLAMLAGAVLAGGYAYCLMRPMYVGTARLCILSPEKNELIWSDFQGGFLLMEDYKQVFQNWEIHDEVRSMLNLTDSCETMANRLTVYNPEKTQILNITYTCESPEQAAEIANAYAWAGKEFILYKMNCKIPTNLSVAMIPGKPVGQGNKYYLALGAIWGTMLAVTVLFFKFVLDESPKTPKDIADEAQIPTLTIIPETAFANRIFVKEGKKHE